MLQWVRRTINANYSNTPKNLGSAIFSSVMSGTWEHASWLFFSNYTSDIIIQLWGMICCHVFEYRQNDFIQMQMQENSLSSTYCINTAFRRGHIFWKTSARGSGSLPYLSITYIVVSMYIDSNKITVLTRSLSLTLSLTFKTYNYREKSEAMLWGSMNT